MTPAQQQIVMSRPIDVGIGGSGLTTGMQVQTPAFDGAGFDFSYPDRWEVCRIRDTVTIANDFRGDPFNKLTYTAPSLKMCRQNDGLYKYGNHNLILQSQTFNSATWGKSQASVTADATTAPDGTTTADKFIPNTTNINHYTRQTFTSVAGVKYQYSIYFKNAGYNFASLEMDEFDFGSGCAFAINLTTGATDKAVSTYGSGWASPVATITDVGNGWYRVTLVATSSTDTACDVLCECYPTAGASTTFAGDGTSGIYVWGAELKRYPVQEATVGVGPVGYIPTVAAVRYDLPYEWDSNGVPLGICCEEARTNLCLRASDFTNASWVKTTMTTALTATGPDGVANSASTLTASGANATALQTITSAVNTRVSSMFVKRRTGSGTINITQDNGTTWTAVTVTADWTRVECPSASVTNPVVGVRIVTSTDAIDVALFQQEVGAFTTSPIQTATASITRAVDNPTLATSLLPFSATVGSLYGKFRPLNTAAIRFAAAIDAGVAERFAIGSSAAAAGYFSVIDGSAEQVGPLTAGTVTANADNKVAAGWVANRFEQATNGTLATVDTSGTLPTVTSLIFGVGGSAASPLNGWLSQLAYYKRTLADAELQALSRTL